MSQEHIEQIELELEDAKAMVALGDALKRLTKNTDFNTVIRQGYFIDEAVRLVGLKAAPSSGSADKQKDILQSIDAIGSLQQHFNAIFMKAQMAQNAITEGAETIAEILAEGVEHE